MMFGKCAKQVSSCYKMTKCSRYFTVTHPPEDFPTVVDSNRKGDLLKTTHLLKPVICHGAESYG